MKYLLVLVLFGTLAYCVLFNGEEQPWNRIPEEEQTYDRIDEDNGRHYEYIRFFVFMMQNNNSLIV